MSELSKNDTDILSGITELGDYPVLLVKKGATLTNFYSVRKALDDLGCKKKVLFLPESFQAINMTKEDQYTIDAILDKYLNKEEEEKRTLD